jgi:hypothetical protein
MEPKNSHDPAYILEFKVYNPKKEDSLQDILTAALAQIREKNYDAVPLAKGISKGQIRHYGFAFMWEGSPDRITKKTKKPP